MPHSVVHNEAQSYSKLQPEAKAAKQQNIVADCRKVKLRR